MKIGVISDIHGNVAALDAVLADAEARQVNHIVNLGDICSGGLFPRETAELLMPLGFPTIRGNHERQLIDQSRERMGPSDRHAADTLRPEHLRWLAALPATMRLFDDVLLVHGTPSNDLTYFLETVTEDGLRTATRDEVEQRAGGTDATVILCGHTHLQRVMSLYDGRMIVNPGSVGLPAYDDDRPHAHRVESVSPMHATLFFREPARTGRRICWQSTMIGSRPHATRRQTDVRTGAGHCGQAGYRQASHPPINDPHCDTAGSTRHSDPPAA